MILGVALTLMPGAWLAFTLGAALPFSSRIGLSIALSPLVFGIAVWLLTAIGLSFTIAGIVATIASLPAAALIWRRRPTSPLTVAWLAPALCFAFVAGGIIALWLIAPEFRIYSWHNMMQVEAVYQVAQLPRAPEEMGLAGVGLNYAWFGHIQIAAIAKLADASPLLVYPIVNIATLLALFLLAIDTVRRLVGDRLVMASFLVTAALLATNLAGILMSYVGLDGGDVRMGTPIHKFLHFDLMSSGFALFFGAMLLALHTSTQRTWRLTALLLATLTAVGLIYPLLFPPAFAVAGALLAMPVLTEWWSGRGFKISGDSLLHLALLVAPLLIWALYLRMLSGGVASVGTELAAPWQIRMRLLDGALKVSAFFLPFVAVAAWRALRQRDPARLALLAAGASMGAIYLVSIMPAHVEYKFAVAAMLCVLPLAVEQAMLWLDKLGRAATPIAAVAAGAVFLAIAPHIATKHVPWRLIETAAPIDETHFSIASVSPDLAWINAVREQTPIDTILVRPAESAPVEVLGQRTAYIALDNDAERPGYTMLARGILGHVKGYPEDWIAHRTAVVASVYAADADFAALDTELRQFGRPVALYLPRGTPFLAWLQAHGSGRAIYEDDALVVWLEPAAT